MTRNALAVSVSYHRDSGIEIKSKVDRTNGAFSKVYEMQRPMFSDTMGLYSTIPVEPVSHIAFLEVCGLVGLHASFHSV